MYHESYKDTQETVSKRIHVTLPDGAFDKLVAWADAEARPIANLASYLLQKVLEEADDQGKIPDKPKAAASDRAK
jgi:CopG-like RHH_1 or ribbon-helix-helix domain, RHH_5